MRSIAAEAGVTTGFVTHYFPGKGALIREALRYNNRRAAKRVASRTKDARGLEAVEAAIEAVLPFDADRRREWQVWIAAWNAGPQDPGSAELRAGWSGLRRLLRSFLEQAVEAGDLSGRASLEYEAERLVAMAAGIGLAAGVRAPSATRARARQMVADHLTGLRDAARDEPKARP